MYQIIIYTDSYFLLFFFTKTDKLCENDKHEEKIFQKTIWFLTFF